MSAYCAEIAVPLKKFAVISPLLSLNATVLAFALVPLARRFGPRKIHLASMILGGVGVFLIPFLDLKEVIFTISNPLGERTFLIENKKLKVIIY